MSQHLTVKGDLVRHDARVSTWLREARDGSTAAFGRLVEHFERPVFAFLIARSGHRDQSEEMVQETFVRAYEGLVRFDEEQGFLPWVLGIAHHVHSEWRRRRAVEARALDAVADGLRGQEAQAPDACENHVQVGTRILNAIQECPESYRLPLTLRYLNEMTYEEIARELELSPGQVKGMLYRGTQMLREKLVDLGCAEGQGRLKGVPR